MKLLNHTLPMLFATLCAGVMPAHAADADHGARVFNEECTACHSIKPGKNKMGPTLFGVAGRGAGSVPDYVYSKALKSSGLAWTADRLDAYLAAPRKVVPGCKMQYEGLADGTARSDLIAFLNNTR
jgi:cytochrome c